MESFGQAWTTLPLFEWTPNFLFTPKGLQYLHIYLWILVDFSWMQGFYYMGDVCGVATVILGGILFIKAVFSRSLENTFLYFTQLLWLSANMYWMSGEVHDIRYQEEEPVYEARTIITSYLLIGAFILATIYFFILKMIHCFQKPNKYSSTTSTSSPFLDDSSISSSNSKFSSKMLCFPRFKDYERIHLLFWIGKDCAWCLIIGPLWMLFFLPTYFMALDYACITLNRKNLLVENSHYMAQFLWVTANGIWAFGEIYSHYDAPMGIFTNDPLRWLTCRWYASWILILALVPVIVMYIIWISNTLSGNITREANIANEITIIWKSSESLNSYTPTLPSTFSNTSPNRIRMINSEIFHLSDEDSNVTSRLLQQL